MRKKNSPSTGNASWTIKKTRPDERARRAQPAHRDRAHVELRARAVAAAAIAERTQQDGQEGTGVLRCPLGCHTWVVAQPVKGKSARSLRPG